jgi:hypothetical protein
MKVNQPAARFVTTEITLNGRMVSHRDAWKTLVSAAKQDGLGAVLVVSRDEKVEVTFAGEHRLNASTALPVAIRNCLALKVL